MDVAELLARSIAALSRADVAALERLAGTVPAAEPPGNQAEWRAVRTQHLALRRLLALTRHNLSLLRDGRAGSYGQPRG
ncbi:MAG TPA: hypothetical protein VMD25_10320 [Acidobacteriaceae bacterium]|nr:hypothetical protein [Acidobacteriaceae bacterium]